MHLAPLQIVLLILTAFLAVANGSNDDAKGVATLAGAGVTRYGIAISWSVIATLAGSLSSLALAGRISTVFTKGIVIIPPGSGFAVAAVAGAVAWVGFATMARLPVSTTHAVVGSMLGAGLLLKTGSIEWLSIATQVTLPLLGSIALSYMVSSLLNLAMRNVFIFHRATLREVRETEAALEPPQQIFQPFTHPCQSCTGPAFSAKRRVERGMDIAHWLTSGATSFARGLNDTPKIWAIGAFGLVPGVLHSGQLLVLVSFAMAVGGALATVRVGRRLGEKVVQMDHAEGFMANLTTAFLVGLGANLGLPMSTTHVATGAIAGVAGRDIHRLDAKTIRDFVIAWIVTPVVAGLVGFTVYLIVR